MAEGISGRRLRHDLQQLNQNRRAASAARLFHFLSCIRVVPMIPVSNFTTPAGRTYAFYDVRGYLGAERYDTLPYAMRILAENIARNIGQPGFTIEALNSLVDRSVAPLSAALPLRVPRVVMPDSTGVPLILELAALRDAVARSGVDPDVVDTLVPIDIVVDHSLIVDQSATPGAEAHNMKREMERNRERYQFLKWGQGAFNGIKLYPPGTGIIHQVHIEQIAKVTLVDEKPPVPVAFPDFAVGGDSHTAMVNGIGVVGWGVGGIEASAVVLGQAYVLPKPAMVGVKLTGKVPEGITMTDVVLTVAQQLRKADVVNTFVEFFGPAAEAFAVSDRAVLSNMSPEHGCTISYWPVDDRTLAYMRLMGHPEAQVQLVEAHTKAAGLFRATGAPQPDYDRVVEIDLSQVARSISGPSKPHNRKATADIAKSFVDMLPEGTHVANAQSNDIVDGAVAIASITSCTNTSNPQNMIRAGLIAKNIVARGLAPKPWVKTSLSPGSRAVTSYLEAAGLLPYLEKLGFHVVGYGCTVCGGKSGSLLPAVTEAVKERGVKVAAVLSGNRNFDARIHPLASANYLCSPPLVVAFAIAGRITIDIDRDAIAVDASGKDVFLRDIWPSDADVDQIAKSVLTPEIFIDAAQRDFTELKEWQNLGAPKSVLFPWDATSNYIIEPPFYNDRSKPFTSNESISGCRAIGVFYDGIPTEHISPSTEIGADSPAGEYLQSLGIAPKDFNLYSQRRANHHVMMRGTYANTGLKNKLTPERTGWYTRQFPEDIETSFYDAAMTYMERGVPVIALGGANFGTGSSRDWAAKGPALLGVRAVIANSFERIHRSNLIGLGIAPLLFNEGDTVESLGLTGEEEFSFANLAKGVADNGVVEVTAWHPAGRTTHFNVRCDVRSPAEADLLMRGGIYRAGLDQVLKENPVHENAEQH
jgi:aconitate hydratase